MSFCWWWIFISLFACSLELGLCCQLWACPASPAGKFQVVCLDWEFNSQYCNSISMNKNYDKSMSNEHLSIVLLTWKNCQCGWQHKPLDGPSCGALKKCFIFIRWKLSLSCVRPHRKHPRWPETWGRRRWREPRPAPWRSRRHWWDNTSWSREIICDKHRIL